LAVAGPAHASGGFEDAIVKLVSAQSGKCLQPFNGNTDGEEPIVQETCNGSREQQWTVHPISATAVHLINQGHRQSRCLGVTSFLIDSGKTPRSART